MKFSGYLVRVIDDRDEDILAQALDHEPKPDRAIEVIGRSEYIEVNRKKIPHDTLAAVLKLCGWKVALP